MTAVSKNGFYVLLKAKLRIPPLQINCFQKEFLKV